jgi:hypothetical protein
MTGNLFRPLFAWVSERRAFRDADPLTATEFAVLREANVEARAVRRHRARRRNVLRREDTQW